jgi:hypothetical protein
VKPVLAILAAIFLSACNKTPQAPPSKHYQLTGKIVSLNASEQTAMIAGAAIPNYMEAMTMDYPVKSKADFNSLHIGDNIQATVNVTDDGVYDLSQITVRK